MVVNKINDLGKKFNQECLIFKVDFKKVYDSPSLGFLDYMNDMFDFDDMSHSCICACVFRDNLYVLLNGCSRKR